MMLSTVSANLPSVLGAGCATSPGAASRSEIKAMPDLMVGMTSYLTRPEPRRGFPLGGLRTVWPSRPSKTRPFDSGAGIARTSLMAGQLRRFLL